MRSQRTLAMLATAILAGSGAANALAQTPSTEQQLKDMSSKIDQLRSDYEKQIADLREAQARLVAETARQSSTPPAAPVTPATSAAPSEFVRVGSFPGSSRIPGTDTSIRVGGFARLDMVKDLNGGESGSVGLTQNTPFSNTPAASRKGFFNMNARQSRLYVRSQTDTEKLGTVTAYVEGDFYGAGGSETATNSSAFRLRHAYLEAGPILAGQTWSNLLDLASLPETLDFSGGNGPLQGIRAGQLRYTAKFAGGTQQFSIAAENPESDVFGTVATTMSAAVGSTNAQTLDTAPDITAKYIISGSWGRVTVGGLARHLVFNNVGGAALNGFNGSSSTNTFAVVSQGRINTFGDDSFQYTVGSGSGIARYIVGSVNNVGAALEDGKLHGIREQAYAVSYTHAWVPGWRSNLVWGQISSDLPHPYVPLETADRISALYANLIWSPVKSSTVGLEYERSEVKNDAVATATASNRGHNNRLDISLQYGF
jgi:hypothetical protein